ncbi:hypothetical protein QBC43DRAFT_351747 [Cladorrhinum sp. PSN259]|nr:hypothetical protein QBC43DRAFT_351747 [Cladorrhinum sp. PSN259]
MWLLQVFITSAIFSFTTLASVIARHQHDATTQNTTASGVPVPWWFQRPTCSPKYGHGAVPKFQVKDMIQGLRLRTGCTARAKSCVALYCHNDLGGGVYLCNGGQVDVTLQCRHLAADLDAIAEQCAPPHRTPFPQRGGGGRGKGGDIVVAPDHYMYRARYGQARPSEHTRLFLGHTGKKCRMEYRDELIYGRD